MSKRILFHLGHPAHFHLFKNVITNLKSKGVQIEIVIKKKDILEELVKKEGLAYKNLLPEGRHDTKFGILLGMLKTDLRLMLLCLKKRPDLMAGTSYAISHVGKFLRIPSINVNEDDCDVVPFYAKFSYPWANKIIVPVVCRTGKWEKKTVRYEGYHELAYLHPKYFTPDKSIVEKYFSPEEPFFLIRFAKLKAHHDDGIRGISTEVAEKLVSMLKAYGRVFITSEIKLSQEFEKFKLSINPKDIHHVMAFASMYIGDSQTMAAEAGVLGTPFIRFNDFVGRISYLEELENKYKLGFGIKPDEEEKLFSVINRLLNTPELKKEWQIRRQKMLAEKIDLTAFLTWFINNYPESSNMIRRNPDYINTFR